MVKSLHQLARVSQPLARVPRRLQRELTFAKAKISSNGLRAWLATLPGAGGGERLCYNPSDHIWLTFDDYATPEQVRALLAILQAKNVAAMFFLTGSWAKAHPTLVSDIQTGGHIVGSHGMEHKNLRHLSHSELIAELSDDLGATYLRPPYGEINPRARRAARRLGQKIMLWTVDSQDWRGITESHIQHNVLSRLHPGAVVLFHLHAPATISGLPELIDRIRRRGFTLPSLSSRATTAPDPASNAR
jgi:peptidoglycan/xylan/chitin deacetylase (PgdA/CDA1 family)